MASRSDEQRALEGADWLASKLERSRRVGDGFVACCPAHDDLNPSLSINEDEHGKVLVHCHAGCEQEHVVETLKELGLWPVPTSGAKRGAQKTDEWLPLSFAPRAMPGPAFNRLCGCKPVDVYEYRDLKGRILGYVCRLEDEEGRKSFRPVTPWCSSTGEYRWRLADFRKPKPLFGLYELADDRDAPVLVVEGEKTAAEAEELFEDYVVVTWPGGAKAVKHVDWRPLEGRDVTIWPDADEPGKQAAAEIAAALGTIGAKSVKMVDLPQGMPQGWDLADQTPKGVDIDALLRGAKTRKHELANFLLSAADLHGMEIPPREMVIVPFLPTRSINLLYAQRGVGKTWVGMTIAKAVATGEDFIGFEVPKVRRVLYIDGEMPLADIKARLEAIGASDLDNIQILASEILFRDFHPLNIHTQDDQRLINEMLAQLEERGCAPDVIILDNLSSLRSGVDENDNTALDDLLRWLVALRHRGYTILLIHHAGKSGDQRGASRLEDFLDVTIKLEPVDADHAATGACFDLLFTKTRGAAFEPSRMRLTLSQADNGILFWHYGEAQKIEPRDRTLKTIFFGPEGDRSRLFKKQTELAEFIDVQKSTISKHVKALVHAGLVSLADEIDVTEAGIERLKALFPDDDFNAE